MKPRRILLIPAGLLVAILLAFFLQDVIRQAVVTPIAYLWWVFNLVYSAVPQLVLWILLLAVIILSFITSLLNGFSFGRSYEQPSKLTRGPVETLTGWILKSGGESNYYKWKIANRLGKLSGEMDAHPQAPGRTPPEEVQRYLKAGLDESFVDYPLPLPFKRKQPTPFDLDVEQAVEFLESQMDDHWENL